MILISYKRFIRLLLRLEEQGSITNYYEGQGVYKYMSRRVRSIIALILCICIAFAGCKKDSKKKDKEADSSGSEIVTDAGEDSSGEAADGTFGNGGNINGGNSSFIPISDKNQPGPPDITGVKKYPADGIGVAGVDYVELATGPANDWGDKKIPYFNPLGSLALYNGGDVSYSDDNGLKLEVMDRYYTNTFITEGEYWQMRINNPDFSLLWLRAYAKKLGATMYESMGDTAVFYVKDNENSQYWVKALSDDRGCYIYVIHNTIVPNGKTITIKPDDYEDNTYSFYTDCVSGKLQSVTVTLAGPDNSGVELQCENDRTYGEYSRILRKEMGNAEEINTKKTSTFIFDDIPISEGQLKWTFDWSSLRGTLEPTAITFKIENIADIKPVKYGEELGLLRVVGVPMGEVELLPGDHNDNRHPDFDSSYIKGTRDKDGNTCFAVPAGYYSIRFGSSDEWGRKNGPPLTINAPGVMRLIPVSAGESGSALPASV